MKDSVYWIWLQLLFGIGTRRAELFMHYFASPKELYLSIQEGSLATEMLEPGERSAWELSMEQAEALYRRTLDKGCQIVTPDHPQYPPLLQNIYSKPAVLYVRGELNCLENAVAIAMVGTRAYTEYGKQAALTLARDLAGHGAVVVSGLAKGIDTFCHQAALEAGGKSIGVLGCGLDMDYPKGSFPLKTLLRKNGAVISEFPFGTPPLPAHFPLRNRILSGICQGVLVVEADDNSGSLITATHALEQGRDVFAVPGSIFSIRQQGTHRLIKDGAKLVESARDVLEEYGYTFTEKNCTPMHKFTGKVTTMIEEVPDTGTQIGFTQTVDRPLPQGLSPEGEAVLALLGKQPVNVETLAQSSDLEIGALQSALTELEIYGLIKVCPGRAFALN